MQCLNMVKHVQQLQKEFLELIKTQILTPSLSSVHRYYQFTKVYFRREPFKTLTLAPAGG